MFRRASSEPVSIKNSDAAIDTIASILRALGRDSFAIGELTVAEIEKRFEEAASKFAFGNQDFGGVRRLVQEHRRSETAFVASSMADMRDGFFSLASRFKALLSTEAEQDSVMHAQLDRLGTVAKSGDMSALRREVATTIDSLTFVLHERRTSSDAALHALNQRVSDLSEQLDLAKKDSEIDALTQLYNRRAFNAELQKLVEVGEHFRESTVLVILDLDRFKAINDNYGHPAGDAVIAAAAKSLLRSFSRQGDFVARYGGEELAVIIKDTSADAAMKHVARYLDVLRDLVVSTGGQKITFTTSAGLAVFKRQESPEEWIRRADAALYEAKRSGRDRAVLAGAA
jgi:diguanylate cyclase (GGDEF)-like protein